MNLAGKPRGLSKRELDEYSEGERHSTRRKSRIFALTRRLELSRSVPPSWRPPQNHCGDDRTLLEHGCRIGLGWAHFPEGHALWGTPGMAGMPSVVDPHQSITLVGDESWVGAVADNRGELGPWRGLELSVVILRGEIPHSVTGLSDAHWVATLEEVPEECVVVIVAGNNPTVEVRSAGVTSFSTASGSAVHRTSSVDSPALWRSRGDAETRTFYLRRVQERHSGALCPRTRHSGISSGRALMP
jgi:hypothetical protein